MALQKQVYIDVAVAVPGQKATPDQAVYTPTNFVAGEDGVAVGTFCWLNATNANVADGTTTGTDAPLGFVERVISAPIYDVRENGTLVIPEGKALTIAVRGDFYVKTTEAATVGGQVYVNKTNGNILAAAGSNGIACPGWRFKTAGSANDMVIISNWGVEVSSGGGTGGTVNLSNVTGTLGIANGGTGATDAATARTNLGAAAAE